MLTKKTIGVAVACALALGMCSGVALATPVNVEGVHWNTDSPFDLNVNALNLRETSVSGVGQTLTGYGQIGSINGNTGFCSGCDLTFQFTYNVSHIGTSANGNPQGVFNDGNIQFFVSSPGTYSEGTPDSAGLGTPWLTLTGHKGSRTGFMHDGQLFSNINGTLSDPTSNSSGVGYLDATGGPAMKYVDSHTITDGMGGFADFLINSSFFTQVPTGCTPTSDLSSVCAFPIQGTGELKGMSVAMTSVPEPGELGMLGLGLGVLGFFLWRRRKDETEDRA